MKQVTAAIITRKEESKEQILICQRAADDECGLLWEFPGGKLEDDETLEECIIREIKEELDLDIRIKDIFMTNLYRFKKKEIFFTVFNAEITGGTLKLNVHNASVWISIKELDEYRFMPPDIRFIEELKKTIDKNKNICKNASNSEYA